MAEQRFAHLFAEHTYPCYAYLFVLSEVRFGYVETMLERRLDGKAAVECRCG